MATIKGATIGGWLLRGMGPYVLMVLIAIGVYFLGPHLNPFHAKIYSSIAIAIIMSVSLNVVNGYTGQFSLGHAGFMAVGAYVSGMVTYYGSLRLWGSSDVHGGFLGTGDLLFLVATISGGAVAALFGYLVGLPSLRLRGDYLAIVTLGFGEIIRVLLQQTLPVAYTAEEASKAGLLRAAWTEQGPQLEGILVRLGGPQGFDGIPKYTSLFWVTVWMLVTLIVCYRLKASIHGRAFLSIRENEIAAEAMGVPTTRYKVSAFTIAAFLAGIGGALFAHDTGVLINPREMGFMRSLDYVIIIVLGGMGSISGCVLAAVGLTILPEALRDFASYRLVIYAALLIVVMIWRPQGLFGIHEVWELKWVRRLIGRFRRGGATHG